MQRPTKSPTCLVSTLLTCSRVCATPEWRSEMSLSLRDRQYLRYGNTKEYLSKSNCNSCNLYVYLIFHHALGIQLSECPGQVYLREDVLVDGHPYQPDAGHQASKIILYWCAGYCWFWDLWCKIQFLITTISLAKSSVYVDERSLN